MSNLIIKKFMIGMVETNTYIIINKNNKEAILVDPADDADFLIQFIEDEHLDCKAILLTHGHFDHIGAAKAVAKYFNIKIYAHENEADLMADPEKNLSIAGNELISIVADVLLKERERFNLAGFDIEAIHTPGHTEGSVCYLFIKEKIIMTGDTLFLEEIGRWDFPTGHSNKLLDSINNKLMMLEDDIVVYPGHDEITSIGHERQYNPYVKK